MNRLLASMVIAALGLIPLKAGAQVLTNSYQIPTKQWISNYISGVTNILSTNLLGGSVFNVKTYGALGTGAVDDSAAVQATFVAASNKGTVYFPPGTYRLKGPIMAYSSVQGEGTLSFFATNISREGLYFQSRSNIYVKDITIDGGVVKYGGTTASYAGNMALFFQYCNNVVVDSVKTINTSRGGANFMYCTNVWVNNSVIKGARGVFGDGIFFGGSQNCWASDNYIYDINRIGIVADTYGTRDGSDNSRNVFITGNRIEYAHDNDPTENAGGIWCELADNVIIEGNNVYNTTSIGIYAVILGETRPSDTNNIFIVANNQVKDTTFAIKVATLQGGFDHVVARVYGNSILGNYYLGIVGVALHTIIENNYFGPKTVTYPTANNSCYIYLANEPTKIVYFKTNILSGLYTNVHAGSTGELFLSFTNIAAGPTTNIVTGYYTIPTVALTTSVLNTITNIVATPYYQPTHTNATFVIRNNHATDRSNFSAWTNNGAIIMGGYVDPTYWFVGSTNSLGDKVNAGSYTFGAYTVTAIGTLAGGAGFTNRNTLTNNYYITYNALPVNQPMDVTIEGNTGCTWELIKTDVYRYDGKLTVRNQAIAPRGSYCILGLPQSTLIENCTVYVTNFSVGIQSDLVSIKDTKFISVLAVPTTVTEPDAVVLVGGGKTNSVNGRGEIMNCTFDRVSLWPTYDGGQNLLVKSCYFKDYNDLNRAISWWGTTNGSLTLSDNTFKSVNSTTNLSVIWSGGAGPYRLEAFNNDNPYPDYLGGYMYYVQDYRVNDIKKKYYTYASLHPTNNPRLSGITFYVGDTVFNDYPTTNGFIGWQYFGTTLTNFEGLYQNTNYVCRYTPPGTIDFYRGVNQGPEYTGAYITTNTSLVLVLTNVAGGTTLPTFTWQNWQPFGNIGWDQTLRGLTVTNLTINNITVPGKAVFATNIWIANPGAGSVATPQESLWITSQRWDGSNVFPRISTINQGADNAYTAINFYTTQTTGETNMPLQIAANGSVVITNLQVKEVNYTSNYWDDLQVPGIVVKTTGPSSPTWNTNGFGSGASGAGAGYYSFTTNQDCWFSVQMPHDWALGTEIRPHIHWTVSATNATAALTNVAWRLDWNAADIGKVWGTGSTSYCYANNKSTPWQHLIDSFTAIPAGTITNLSAIINMRLSRVLGTNDMAGSVGFLQFDMHYMKSSPGSRQEIIK